MDLERITKEELIEEYNLIWKRYELMTDRSIKLKKRLDEVTKIANKLAAKNIELNLLLQAKVERIRK